MVLTYRYYLLFVAVVCFLRAFITDSREKFLSRIPGPQAFAISRWLLAFEDWKGTRTRTINQLHQKYGPAIRIGPNEVSFNSTSALRTIYGAGSGFERTSFYRMFDVYGRQNLFTFHSAKLHGDRKKILAHAYSKSVMLKDPVSAMIEEKVRQYLKLLESEPDGISEIFSTLHYYSLDNITFFLYGSSGATAALIGNASHRALLNDVLDPTRRKLSWFAVHFPSYTRWLYNRTGVVGKLVKPFLPMQKPATYTGIRQHALQAFQDFEMRSRKENLTMPFVNSILDRLWMHHESNKTGGLDDMAIASECADHFLAGIDTTSDTLMFLIWALSLPENIGFQDKLIEEVCNLPQSSLNKDGIPSVEASDKLILLDAIIKETLRLYAPLPASEPRSMPVPMNIDSFDIPAGVTVSMSPYSLHRNSEVFKDPLVFNPNRWLKSPESDLIEMKKWWWAFSSGSRMCIGIHLAMAEMTTLTAAIYRIFRTSIAPGYEGATPAITSRFEVFYDERFPRIEEHACYIKFRAHDIS